MRTLIYFIELILTMRINPLNWLSADTFSIRLIAFNVNLTKILICRCADSDSFVFRLQQSIVVQIWSIFFIIFNRYFAAFAWVGREGRIPVLLLLYLCGVIWIRLGIESFASAWSFGSLFGSLGKFFIMEIFHYFAHLATMIVIFYFVHFLLLFYPTLFEMQVIFVMGWRLWWFLVLFFYFTWFSNIILVLDTRWPLQIADVDDYIIASLSWFWLVVVDMVLIARPYVLSTTMAWMRGFNSLFLILLFRHWHHSWDLEASCCSLIFNKLYYDC